MNEVIRQIKFLSGVDTLSDTELLDLIGFAVDDYSLLAFTSANRKWNLDDSTNTDFEIITATLNASEDHIPLESETFSIHEVTFEGEKLQPIDKSDNDTQTLTEIYGSTGTPKAYDYNSHSLFIYPVPNRTGVIEITGSRPFTRPTSTGDTLGVPRVHQSYIILHAVNNVMLRTNDSNKNNIKSEFLETEQKIKDSFGVRDQAIKQRLKPLIQNNK